VARRIDRAISADDFRAFAKGSLPKILFDYVEGGVEDEVGLSRVRESFERWRLVPRYLRDVERRTTGVMLFGQPFAAPIGIAPTGLAGLLRPGADLMLARAAVATKVPYIMSGVSNDKLEAAAAHGAWYQLYPAHDRQIMKDITRRAADAGIKTLVLTVDLPVVAKRERDVKNGFQFPPRLTPRLIVQALMRPRWTLRYLASGGFPTFANWTPYADAPATPHGVARLVKANSPASLTWNDLDRLREQWSDCLIVKGILHPQDAVTAREHGADGVIVSSHGSRQLDRSVLPLDVLAEIRIAVGNDFPLMLDGGIRRGSDAAIALCLGADFVFAGRTMLYGAAAEGEAGVKRTIDLLCAELSAVMGQLGVARVSELNSSYLWSEMPRRLSPGQPSVSTTS
jgi:isopentenyl diphosphate isomerase/L-lactate dehydrogenase-like FMN-dependent dehydrogenase